MSPFDKIDLKFLGVISMPVFGSIIFGIISYLLLLSESAVDLFLLLGGDCFE